MILKTGGDGVHLSLRLFNCLAGLKASHDLIGMIFPFREQFAYLSLRHKHLRLVGHLKSGWQHPHDRVAFGTELDRAA